ncbi:hypothetical protein GCM10027034_10420 [Ramlibacter solisilvae]
MLEQHLARFGGHRPPAIAQQQRLPQFDFEQPHLPAQRGLRDFELERGAREAAEFGDPDKVFKLFEIHPTPNS